MALACALLVGGSSGAGAGALLDATSPVTGSAPVQAQVAPSPEPTREVRVVPDEAATTSSRREQVPTAPEVPTPATPPTPLETLEPDDGLTDADRSAGLLSARTPGRADGDLVVVAGQQAAPDPQAPVRTVRVEVESGLPVDGDRFAATVMEILNDERGWGADGAMSFARTDGEAEIRVVLASPTKVDEMCAPLRTQGLYSCGRYGHAAINHMRWVKATDEFDDLTVYRQYVINHEVGHLLGHPHEDCAGEGEVAHVMQQQTIYVAPCTANPWPHP